MGPEYPELNSESRTLLDRLGQELRPTDDAEIVGVRCKLCIIILMSPVRHQFVNIHLWFFFLENISRLL